MTLDEIHAGIDAIKQEAHNAENAHALEDKLRDDVLFAIAHGELFEDAAELVLTTSEIKFPRWYS